MRRWVWFLVLYIAAMAVIGSIALLIRWMLS